MREFLEKTWVLFVAVGVIAVSAVVLLTSVTVSRNVGVQNAPGQAADVEKVGTPVETLPAVRTSQPEAEFETPVFLLTLDESALTLPQAKDIEAGEAANIAARSLEQLFDADLEGEICNVFYLSGLGANMDNRWDAWNVAFGDPAQQPYTYAAMLNSVSGEVMNAYKATGGAATEPEKLDGSEKQAFVDACTARAEELAAKYFLNGYGVGGIEYASLEMVEYDNETGYVSVFPDGENGPALLFGFCRMYGGLVSVERLEDDQVVLLPEEPATVEEVMANEGG